MIFHEFTKQERNDCKAGHTTVDVSDNYLSKMSFDFWSSIQNSKKKKKSDCKAGHTTVDTSHNQLSKASFDSS